jgi:hypothetical protein
MSVVAELLLLAAVALPKDGGEPAKVYRACLDALAKTDKDAIVELCFAKDDPWLAKANLGYYTPETLAVEVKRLNHAYRLVDVKISGGKMEGDDAELAVAGTAVLMREEPTGDIVEVDRKPVKGTVYLRRGASGWRYVRESFNE